MYEPKIEIIMNWCEVVKNNCDRGKDSAILYNI